MTTKLFESEVNAMFDRLKEKVGEDEYNRIVLEYVHGIGGEACFYNDEEVECAIPIRSATLPILKAMMDWEMPELEHALKLMAGIRAFIAIHPEWEQQPDKTLREQLREH
jgi:hypothetical protein